MTMITDTDDLANFCMRLASADYITVDTEFMRENTYWPRLCVMQMAGPDEAAAVDALAEGIDLQPAFDLLLDRRLLKVFHSARQDIEIVVQRTGQVPTPLYDTQIAAMVCGFGESVGYEALIRKLVGARIDKVARFTDWSRRPLTPSQLNYALADVTHLRPAFEKLRRRIARAGRESWLEEDMALLSDIETYIVRPEEAWRRLKLRSTDPKFLAILREVAAWREREAQRRDLPRGRMLRDDALVEIAAHAPRTAEALSRTRGLSRNMAEGWQGTALLAAVERGLACPADERPRLERKPELPQGLGPTVDLLRVLLKMTCEEAHVAQRLVASTEDLEQIAANDDAAVPALRGWRRTVFGDAALDLKHGRTGLAIDDKRLRVVAVEPSA